MSSPENILKEREEERAEQARRKAERGTLMTIEIIDFLTQNFPSKRDFHCSDLVRHLKEHLPGHREFVVPVRGTLTVDLLGRMTVRARTKEEAEAIAMAAFDDYAGEITSDIGYYERWEEYTREQISDHYPTLVELVEMDFTGSNQSEPVFPRVSYNNETGKVAGEGVQEFVIPVDHSKTSILRGDMVVRARTREDAEWFAKEAADEYLLRCEDNIYGKVKQTLDFVRDALKRNSSETELVDFRPADD